MRRVAKWLPACPADLVFLTRRRGIILRWNPSYGVRPLGWFWDVPGAGVWDAESYYTDEDYMKRRMTESSEGVAPEHYADVESNVFTSMHSIVAHLAVTRYDDGTARQPGTLLIRTVGASWQVTAKEPDSAAQLVVTAPTIDDALAALSLLLESDQTPWQPDPWAKKMGGTGTKRKA